MSDLVLGIETSTPIGSVAVGVGTTTLAEVTLGERSKHSESLLPAIDYVLRTAGATKDDLGAVVVGGGPGSFTGLRISAATAKALARSLDIPLFAYSGLCAVAANIGAPDQTICAMFDARRGEVYAAAYRFPEFKRIETVLEPGPRHIDEVRAWVSAAGAMVAPQHLSIPRATSLIWLHHIAPADGRVADLSAWEPLYLRDSGAERMKAR